MSKLFKAVCKYLCHKPFSPLGFKFWKNLKEDTSVFYMYSKMKDRPKTAPPPVQKICYITNSSLTKPNYFANNPLNYSGGNVGNFVFTRALERYLLTYDNYPLCSSKWDTNAHITIINCANLLDESRICVLENFTKQIKKTYSRVFFIGIGAQFSLDYKLTYSSKFKKTAQNFIKSVYDSGGAFGLRGYFTAELFEKLGCREYTVIGCPSMYVNGKDFKVSNDKVSYDNFRPMMHDFHEVSLFCKKNNVFFKNNKNVTYISQDRLYDYIFRKKELPVSYPHIIDMFENGRVKLLLDLDDWIKEIKKHNFQFGKRFHGAALSITNGIPAFVTPFDSRVREMCEFFSIPHKNTADYTDINLYNLYLKTDYSEFNKNYNKNYENFKSFFDKNGIQNLIGQENRFIDWLIENKSYPDIHRYN